MKIELPESLHAWAAEQARLTGHTSPDAYVAYLLTREQLRETLDNMPAEVREAIDKKLLEALDSGEPVEATPEFWEERRRVLAERLKDSGKAAG